MQRHFPLARILVEAAILGQLASATADHSGLPLGYQQGYSTDDISTGKVAQFTYSALADLSTEFIHVPDLTEVITEQRNVPGIGPKDTDECLRPWQCAACAYYGVLNPVDPDGWRSSSRPCLPAAESVYFETLDIFQIQRAFPLFELGFSQLTSMFLSRRFLAL